MGRVKYTPRFKQEFQKNKEVRYSDVKYLGCFCFMCKKDIGGVNYLDTVGNYPLDNIPLCYSCWTDFRILTEDYN